MTTDIDGSPLGVRTGSPPDAGSLSEEVVVVEVPIVTPSRPMLSDSSEQAQDDRAASRSPENIQEDASKDIEPTPAGETNDSDQEVMEISGSAEYGMGATGVVSPVLQSDSARASDEPGTLGPSPDPAVEPAKSDLTQEVRSLGSSVFSERLAFWKKAAAGARANSDTMPPIPHRIESLRNAPSLPAKLLPKTPSVGSFSHRITQNSEAAKSERRIEMAHRVADGVAHREHCSHPQSSEELFVLPEKVRNSFGSQDVNLSDSGVSGGDEENQKPNGASEPTLTRKISVKELARSFDSMESSNSTNTPANLSHEIPISSPHKNVLMSPITTEAPAQPSLTPNTTFQLRLAVSSLQKATGNENIELDSKDMDDTVVTKDAASIDNSKLPLVSNSFEIPTPSLSSKGSSRRSSIVRNAIGYGTARWKRMRTRSGSVRWDLADRTVPLASSACRTSFKVPSSAAKPMFAAWRQHQKLSGNSTVSPHHGRTPSYVSRGEKVQAPASRHERTPGPPRSTPLTSLSSLTAKDSQAAVPGSYDATSISRIPVSTRQKRWASESPAWGAAKRQRRV